MPDSRLPLDGIDKLVDDVAKRGGTVVPTDNILFFGIGQENLQKFLDKVRAPFSEFGNVNVPLGLDPVGEAAKRNQQLTNSFGSIINSFTPAMRVIREKHEFERMPAFSVASGLLSGYSAAVMDGLREAESIKYEYGNIVSGTLGALAMRNIMRRYGSGAAARIATRVGAGGLLARSTARVGTAVARANALLRQVTVVSRLTSAISKVLIPLRLATVASAVAAPVTAGTSLGSAITFAALSAAVELVRYASHLYTKNVTYGRARRLGLQKSVTAMFDRSRIANEFLGYQGVFQGIPGYDNDGYGLLDRTRELTYRGLSPSLLGTTYENIIKSYQSVASRADVGDSLPDYVARITSMEGVFGLPGSPAITNSFANIVKSSADKNIEDSTRAFEEFFVAVAGGGKLHTSYLDVVNSLAEFSFDYAAGQKFVHDSHANIAKIAGFMGRATDRKLTADPTTQMIQTVDEAMMSGVAGQNWAVLRLLNESDISQYEAIKGVTNDADVFNRFIGGIVRTTGVGVETFDEDGGLKQNDAGVALYRMLATTLRLDSNELPSVVAAVRSYVSGNRAETVYGEFSTRAAVEAVSNDRYDLIRVITEGNITLSKVIHINAKTLTDLSKALYEAHVTHFPNGMARAGYLVADTIRKINNLPPVKRSYEPGTAGSSQGRTSPSTPSTPSRTPTATPPATPPVGQGVRALPPYPSLVNPEGSRGVDARFYNDKIVSKEARAVLASMFSGMAQGANVRTTGVSGVQYDNMNGTNVGFDIAIEGGQIHYPFKEEGEVLFSGERRTRRDNEPTYGNSIVIKLPNGALVSFSHMAEESSLKAGDKVSAGQFIGTQGATGTRRGRQVSTGPHVDIEFYAPGATVEGNVVRGTLISDPDEQAKLVEGFVTHQPSTYEIPEEEENIDRNNSTGYNNRSLNDSALMHFDIEVDGFVEVRDIANGIISALS
jgi:hypothetical protein